MQTSPNLHLTLAVQNIAALMVSPRLKATDLPGSGCLSSYRSGRRKLHILCRSPPAVLTFKPVHTVCLWFIPVFISFKVNDDVL